MKKTIFVIGLIILASISFGAGFIMSTVYGDDDENDEQAIESNDDKPFINMTLKNNGSLMHQLDNLQQLLCKMNIEHGAPGLNGPECLP